MEFTLDLSVSIIVPCRSDGISVGLRLVNLLGKSLGVVMFGLFLLSTMCREWGGLVVVCYWYWCWFLFVSDRNPAAGSSISSQADSIFCISFIDSIAQAEIAPILPSTLRRS